MSGSGGTGPQAASLDVNVTDNATSTLNTVAEALDNTGAAADAAAASITAVDSASVMPNVGASAAKLRSQFDQLTQLENQATRTAAALAKATPTLAQDTATNPQNAEANAAVFAKLTTNAQTAASALQAFKDVQASVNSQTASSVTSTNTLTQASTNYVQAVSRTGSASTALAGSVAKDGQQIFAARQTLVQFTQGLSGLFTGQDLLTVAIQQGHQLADVAETTGVSLITSLGGALQKVIGWISGPLGFTAALAAVVAGDIYLGVQSGLAGQKLIDLSNRFKATRDDAMDAAAAATSAAKAFTAANGGSLATNTQVADTVAQVPGFNNTQANLTSAEQQVKDLTAVFGDGTKALNTYVEALTDPVKAVDDLAKSHFPGFTAALKDNIDALVETGHSADATQLILDTLATKTKGAAEELTPMGQALKDLGDAFRSAASEGSGFWGAIKSTLAEGITNDIKFLTGQINGLHQAYLSIKADMDKPSSAAIGGSINPGYQSPAQQAATAVGAANQSSLQTTITTLSSILNVSNDALTALQKAEGKIDPASGQWEDNGNAIGAFQIKRDTFYGTPGKPGTGIINQTQQFPQTADAIQVAEATGQSTGLDNPTINATAGAELFSNLLKQFNGDVWDATLAYHYGPSVAEAFINGGKPKEIAADGGAGITEANTVTAAVGGSSFSGRSPTQGGSTNFGAAPTNVMDSTQQDAANAAADVKALNLLSVQIDATKKEIEALQADQAKADPSSTRYTNDGVAIDQLKGKLTTLKSGTDQYLISLAKQAEIADQSTAAGKALAAAVQTVNDANQRQYGQDASAAEQTAARAGAQKLLNDAFDQSIDKINESTTANEAEAAATANGATATQHEIDYMKAVADAKNYATSTSGNLQDKINTETEALDKNAASQADVATAKDNASAQKNLDYIKEETSLIGENTAAATKDLAVYQEKQKLLAQPGVDINSTQSQAALQLAGDTADAQSNLSQMQQSLTDLQNIGTTAFNAVGDAITNAFVNGSQSGINFGSVMKGVLAQVLEAILKLAVLNPILNSLGFGGGSLTTLSSAISGIGGGGGSNSGGSVVGTASTVVGGVSQVAGLASGTGSTSGLGGIGSNLSSIYSLGKGIYSGFTGGGFTTGIPFIDAGLGYDTGIGASGVGATGGYEGAAGAGEAVGGAGASVGSLIGGAGAGFALGSLLNQYVFKGNQTNGEIGAGVGAIGGSIAGAAIAGIPTLGIGAPIGALLGGLIGGTLGGAGGGLIGPKLPNYGYEVTEAGQSNGLLGISKSGGEGDPGGQAAQALAKQVSAYNDSFNQILAQAGISATGSTILGANNYSSNGKGDKASGNAGKETTDLNSIFDNLSFSSTNPILNKALTDPATKPTDITGLANISDAFTDLSKTLVTLLNPLTGVNDAIGSYGTALANLDANYAQGIKDATTLGMSTKSLTDAQATADAALKKAAQDQVTAQLNTYQQRDETATGFGGAAQVQAQQQAAEAETAAFSKSLTDLYGTNFKNTAEYASDMAQLAKTQADEQAARVLADQQAYQTNSNTFTSNTEQAQGNPVDEQTTLSNFDIAGQQQITALQSQLSGMLAEGAISTQQYYAQIVQLDNSLAAQRLQIDQQYTQNAKAELETLQQQDMSYTARTDSAQGDQESADLINQAISGQQELSALQNQVTSYYGTGANAQAIYAQQSAQLEATLAAEKLAIQQKYNGQSAATGAQAAAEQAAIIAADDEEERQALNAAYQQVNSLFSNITNYVKQLEGSSLSPLSPDQQYAAQASNFSSEAAGALKGNTTDLGDITTAANAFLTASQAVNGSGQQYLSDYNQVIAVLSQIASSSVINSAAGQLANQQNLTGQQQSVQALQALQLELTKLRNEIAQASAKP